MSHAPALPDGLSPSSIGTYIQCPKRFREEKINGRESPSTYAAELGTFVHLILEKLMQRPVGERALDDARECAREAWRETLDVEDFQKLNLSDQQQRDFRWSAWQSIETYFNEIENPADVDVVATEQKVNTVINGVPVRGTVDRLERDPDGKIVVSDYKNGKAPDSRFPDQAEGKERQMKIYAAMIRETTGKLPDRGRLIFTAHGVDYPVDFSEEAVDETMREVKSVWQKIHEDFADDRWITKPSGLCSWCPFIEECGPGTEEGLRRLKTGKMRTDAPGYAYLSGLSPR